MTGPIVASIGGFSVQAECGSDRTGEPGVSIGVSYDCAGCAVASRLDQFLASGKLQCRRHDPPHKIEAQKDVRDQIERYCWQFSTV